MFYPFILVIGIFSGVYSQAGRRTCSTDQVCEPSSNGAVDCLGDCSCRDNLADECGRPHPTTSVHTDSIQDCMANCQVFALEGRCKFIMYHFDNIDENCIIMNDNFESYIGHCNQRGQALWGLQPGQGLARWTGCLDENHCTNDGLPTTHSCNTCTDCQKEGCRGYVLSDCTVFSEALETSAQTSLDHCEIWARTTSKGTYAIYNREQGECEVYGDEVDNNSDGIERSCRVALVELGTDPIDCGTNPDPTDPPTPSPPDCTEDGDCGTGEICTVDHICGAGCRADADCGEHPCTEGIQCRYCDTTASIDGVCVPGCGDPSDCPPGDHCNGMHMCTPPGALLLDTLSFSTAKCQDCAGTNIEVGASIWIKGYLPDSAGCVTGNLDHEDRVDYREEDIARFRSDQDQMGGCTYANMAGFVLSVFTVTWHGEGAWTPATFTATFTATNVTAVCAFSGNPFQTGDSRTINCENPALFENYN